MPLHTDWRLELLGYDFTAKTEWTVDIEETLGRPGSLRARLQDEDMASTGDFADLDPGGIGFNLAELPVKAYIDGVDAPLFQGKILDDSVDLPEAFPWRIHDIVATDWQREVFDRRYVGVPGGDNWLGPDSDGNYIAVDGGASFGLGGSIAGAVTSLFDNYAGIPAFIGTIDATTFVNEYGNMQDAPYTAEKATVRSMLDWLAGQASGNVQYWLDTLFNIRWQAIPRWFEQESPAYYLTLGLPATSTPMEAAPVEINNDSNDGVTSIGCRNLGWGFDYGSVLHQNYVSGSVGYKYNGGVVDKGGTGWIVFNNPSAPIKELAQGILDAPDAVDLASKLNAGRRAERITDRGILRGHLTVGNERHHPDGWHVGQYLKITDARMGAMSGRYYAIQRVRTKLVPFTNWRIHDIEWGDAPLARASTRRPLIETNKEIQEPGRLWDITGRIQNPLPSSTITVVGQLLNERHEPRRAEGIEVELELHVWDETGTPQTGVGSISPTAATSDVMGRWTTDLTVGPGKGWSYCVCPIGSGACALPV